MILDPNNKIRGEKRQFNHSNWANYHLIWNFHFFWANCFNLKRKIFKFHYKMFRTIMVENWLNEWIFHHWVQKNQNWLWPQIMWKGLFVLELDNCWPLLYTSATILTGIICHTHTPSYLHISKYVDMFTYLYYHNILGFLHILWNDRTFPIFIRINLSKVLSYENPQVNKMSS